MSFNNRNNLPNPSAPWGREVEQRIEGAERNISQTSLESSNGLSSTNNTLAALSNTINALLEQQTRIVESRQMVITPQGYVGPVPDGVNWYRDQFSATYIPPAWANSARVTFSASNMYGGAYRVAGVGLSTGGSSFNGTLEVTMKNFADTLGSKTMAQMATIWSGKTMGQVAIEPLRTA